MLFTDIIFAPFLVLTFLLFAWMRRRPRRQLWVFVAASYVFYGWWEVRFLSLILFSTLLDFYVGRALHRRDDPRVRRWLLAASLTGNLGLLAYFKYAGFFVDSLAAGLAGLGFDAHLPTLSIVLPVGISFYTFQTLSYTLDIYWRKLEPTRSLLEFAVFVSAFPQLVAGPIVRAREFLPQLRGNLFERSDPAGLLLIFYGLMKKMYVADRLGVLVVDPVFQDPSVHGALDVAFAANAYGLQIFLDFSAYSDIAIGLGLLFGLRFPTNFRWPYVSRNPSEFWRRWHISLSTWLRDYLYLPLGGNRRGTARLYANLMIVMLLGGLWHGASWTFVAWGALHGLYLVVHRAWRDGRRRAGSDPDAKTAWPVAALQAFVMVQLVALTWVLFRAPDFGVARDVLARLGHWSAPSQMLTAGSLILFGVALAIHYGCEPFIVRVARAFGRLPVLVQAGSVYVGLSVLYLMARAEVTNRAFIYFQF